MEVLIIIAWLVLYIGSFISFIVAAALHAWFAFVGFLLCWIVLTIVCLYLIFDTMSNS